MYCSPNSLSPTGMRSAPYPYQFISGVLLAQSGMAKRIAPEIVGLENHVKKPTLFPAIPKSAK